MLTLLIDQLSTQCNSTQLNWVKSDNDYWYIHHVKTFTDVSIIPMLLKWIPKLGGLEHLHNHHGWRADLGHRDDWKGLVIKINASAP